MPPVPGVQSFPNWNPRVICYYQTYHDNGHYTSLLPFITNPSGITHVILAAIHINADPKSPTLNDHPPDHSMYEQLWDEVVVLQDNGVKVLGMLGGAAKGSFTRLDWNESRSGIPTQRFETYYVPLRDMIRRYGLDGLDLDVEEEMSLSGIIHLVDRLKADFGPDFLITLAPVATALMQGRRHLSGFDYRLLEAARGSSIAWYNVQFYNGWGFLFTTYNYDEIMRNGWSPEKVIVGMLTNPRHGTGYVPLPLMSAVLSLLVERYPRFGGVMGWEYWQALPDVNHPWRWAWSMSLSLGMKKLRDAAVIVAMGRSMSAINVRG